MAKRSEQSIFFSPKNSDGAEGTEWQKSQTDTFSKNLKWMEVQHSRRIFISFFFQMKFSFEIDFGPKFQFQINQ